MIYVECKPDATLVRSVTGFPKRRVVHENGKFEVVNRLRKRSDCRGLVDEDPTATQPAYIERMSVLEDLPDKGLRLLHDASNNNHVILLCPRLEEWVVRVARSASVDLSSYGLPGNPNELHRRINANLGKFEGLVEDLKNTDMFRTLRQLLRG